MARYTLRTLTLAPELRAATAPSESSDKPLRFSKPLAVAIYLCAKSGGQATRDELIALLWEGTELQDARQAFRRVVYQLRNTIGREHLTGDEVLTLDKRAIEFDVDVFHSRLKANAAADAIDVYQADFLAAVSLPGAREFELWAEGLRRQLAVERRQAIRSLIADARDSGRWSVAAKYARLLAESDPLDLETRVTLVECLTRAGDAVAAAAAAEDARRAAIAVRGERLPPMVETAIALALKSGGSTEPRATNGLPISAEMVGRATQYRTIVDLWTQAVAGRGSTALVTGEAGIGKTRLVEELQVRFRRDGGLVLAGACYAVERSDPLAPLFDLVRQSSGNPGLGGALPASLGVLAAFVPEVAARFGHTAPAPARPIERELLMSALIDAFAAIAAESPLVLIVEDLHWAGAATVEFAHRLARRAGSERILLILTARDVGATPESTDALRALAAADAVHEVNIGQLDAADVEQLMGSIADLPTGLEAAALAAKLVRHTGGVPLRVLEVLKALEESGDAVVQNGVWTASAHLRDPARDLPAARSLQAVVESRLHALGQQAVTVYTALAVWGRDATAGVLASLTGLSEADVGRAIGVLEHRRWIARTDGTVRSVHEELRAAALRSAPSAAVNEMYGRAAEFLERSSETGRAPDWYAVARHAALAGQIDRAALSAARGTAMQERVSGRAAGRDALALVLGAVPPAIQAELRSSLRRVLDGHWSADRWLAERDGRARKSRWTIGVAATVVLGVGSWLVAKALRPNPADLVGGGLITVGWHWVGDTRADTVLALAIDHQYVGHSLRRRLLPPGYRDGFSANQVSPDFTSGLFTCSRQDESSTVVCRIRFGANDTTVVGRSEGDANFGGWFRDGFSYVLHGGYDLDRGYPYGLQVADTTGRVRSTIVRDGFSYQHARLSPANDRVVALRDRTGDHADTVVLFDVAGEPAGTIDWCGPIGVAPWSPDGAQLVCTSRTHDAILIGPARPGSTPQFRVPVHHIGTDLLWSPNGEYVVGIAGDPERQLVVVNARLGGNFRPVTVDLPKGAMLLGWTPPPPWRPLAGVRLSADSAKVLPGHAAMTAIGFDHRGRPLRDPPLVQWTFTDPTVAHAGPNGLVADRPGRTTVIISLGPSLGDTAVLVVDSAAPELLLYEDFDDTLHSDRWRRFGLPATGIVPDGFEGPSLGGRGDMSHTSGVVSMDTFGTGNGLTIEYSIRSAFGERDQRRHVGLWIAPADSFREVDQDPYPSLHLNVARAELVLAARDSGDRAATLGGQENGGNAPIPADLYDDQWHHYRLVLYATGWLRWFVDDKEFVAVSEASIDMSSAPRVTLEISGKGSGALPVVDNVRVWAGVCLPGVRCGR